MENQVCQKSKTEVLDTPEISKQLQSFKQNTNWICHAIGLIMKRFLRGFQRYFVHVQSVEQKKLR